jgi:hypothetical protein
MCLIRLGLLSAGVLAFVQFSYFASDPLNGANVTIGERNAITQLVADRASNVVAIVSFDGINFGVSADKVCSNDVCVSKFLRVRRKTYERWPDDHTVPSQFAIIGEDRTTNSCLMINNKEACFRLGPGTSGLAAQFVVKAYIDNAQHFRTNDGFPLLGKSMPISISQNMSKTNQFVLSFTDPMLLQVNCAFVLTNGRLTFVASDSEGKLADLLQYPQSRASEIGTDPSLAK